MSGLPMAWNLDTTRSTAGHVSMLAGGMILDLNLDSRRTRRTHVYGGRIHRFNPTALPSGKVTTLGFSQDFGVSFS